MTKDFTALELGILKWLRDNFGNSTLPAQLNTARFTKREYTGAGYFVYFTTDHSLPKSNATQSGRPWPINGPVIKSPEIEHDGSSLLWGDKEGYANCIEVFAFGNKFAESVTEFQLVDAGSYNK